MLFIVVAKKLRGKKCPVFSFGKKSESVIRKRRAK